MYIFVYAEFSSASVFMALPSAGLSVTIFFGVVLRQAQYDKPKKDFHYNP
jgi:hypothetical protein